MSKQIKNIKSISVSLYNKFTLRQVGIQKNKKSPQGKLTIPYPLQLITNPQEP